MRFCTLKCPNSLLFLISRYFHNVNLKCVHILYDIHSLKTKIKKYIKQFSRGVRDSNERPKIRRFRRKGYAKTNKYLGMLCYIKVEYNVFLSLVALF